MDFRMGLTEGRRINGGNVEFFSEAETRFPTASNVIFEPN
jgi:hypothetical protein